MRTVTLSLVAPKPGFDLRVSTETDERGIRIWPERGTTSHLSVVVAEGAVVPYAVFENGRIASISSIKVTRGQVESGGRRISPLFRYTSESIVQKVRIVPSMFSKKEY